MLNLQERANLVILYSEPQRHYHTLEHIFHCLRELEDFSENAEAGDRNGWNSLVVEKAIWFHDCVYDPQASAGKNEKESMSIAYGHLCAQFRGYDAFPIEVSEIIEKTDHRSVAETANQKIMLDIDLAILGSTDVDYVSYVRKIRQEYSFLSRERWLAGRSRFLASLLCKKRLYYTEYFYKKYESRARKNIQMELDNLHLWL